MQFVPLRTAAIHLPVTWIAFGQRFILAMHYAAQHDADPAVAALLLEAGADIEQVMGAYNPGATPLYGSAVHGQPRAVRRKRHRATENGAASDEDDSSDEDAASAPSAAAAASLSESSPSSYA